VTDSDEPKMFRTLKGILNGEEPPDQINGLRVVEYGFYSEPTLPVGYVRPPGGQYQLEAVQNLAICTANGIEGYYLLFCTHDWKEVTYSFNETLEHTKRCPHSEFGHDVLQWHRRHG